MPSSAFAEDGKFHAIPRRGKSAEITPLLFQVRGLHGEPAVELPRHGPDRHPAVVPLPAGDRPLPAGADHSDDEHLQSNLLNNPRPSDMR